MTGAVMCLVKKLAVAYAKQRSWAGEEMVLIATYHCLYSADVVFYWQRLLFSYPVYDDASSIWNLLAKHLSFGLKDSFSLTPYYSSSTTKLEKHIRRLNNYGTPSVWINRQSEQNRNQNNMLIT